MQWAFLTWRFYLFGQPKSPWSRSLPPWDKGVESLPFSPWRVTTNGQAKWAHPELCARTGSGYKGLGEELSASCLCLGARATLWAASLKTVSSWWGSMEGAERCLVTERQETPKSGEGKLMAGFGPLYSVWGFNISFIRLPQRVCWGTLQVVIGPGLPKTKVLCPRHGHVAL